MVPFCWTLTWSFLLYVEEQRQLCWFTHKNVPFSILFLPAHARRAQYPLHLNRSLFSTRLSIHIPKILTRNKLDLQKSAFSSAVIGRGDEGVALLCSGIMCIKKAKKPSVVVSLVLLVDNSIHSLTLRRRKRIPTVPLFLSFSVSSSSTAALYVLQVDRNDEACWQVGYSYATTMIRAGKGCYIDDLKIISAISTSKEIHEIANEWNSIFACILHIFWK